MFKYSPGQANATAIGREMETHKDMREVMVKRILEKYHQFQNLEIGRSRRKGWTAFGKIQYNDIDGDVLSIGRALVSMSKEPLWGEVCLGDNFNLYLADAFDKRILRGFTNGKFIIRKCDTLKTLREFLDIANYINYLETIESIRLLFLI